MKFDTKVVRSGITPDPTTGAIVPPIYQTATYVLEVNAGIIDRLGISTDDKVRFAGISTIGVGC